jgi:hypothetical protein
MPWEGVTRIRADVVNHFMAVMTGVRGEPVRTDLDKVTAAARTT